MVTYIDRVYLCKPAYVPSMLKKKVIISLLILACERMWSTFMFFYVWNHINENHPTSTLTCTTSIHLNTTCPDGNHQNYVQSCFIWSYCWLYYSCSEDRYATGAIHSALIDQWYQTKFGEARLLLVYICNYCWFFNYMVRFFLVEDLCSLQ